MYVKGGVCIYVLESLSCNIIDLTKYCIDKDFEACAIKLHLNTVNVCIITIYRAPTGNFALFITKLDLILKKLYTFTQVYVIVGDININYLVDSFRKSQLEALLLTYNLTSVKYYF
jgi:hypothetical protein